jgi:hypothetical protein
VDDQAHREQRQRRPGPWPGDGARRMKGARASTSRPPVGPAASGGMLAFGRPPAKPADDQGFRAGVSRMPGAASGAPLDIDEAGGALSAAATGTGSAPAAGAEALARMAALRNPGIMRPGA